MALRELYGVPRPPQPEVRPSRSIQPGKADPIQPVPFRLLSKVAAHDAPPLRPVSFSIAALSPVPIIFPITRRVTAHTPLDRKQYPWLATIVGSEVEAAAAEIQSRRVAAHSPIQQLLGSRNFLIDKVTAAPSPLLRKSSAHEPKTAYPTSYSILNVSDLVPDPLTTKVKAFEFTQKVMQALSILFAPTEVAATLDPLRVRTVIAHNLFQRVEPYHLVAARDNAPDPLRTRRIEAFNLPQKIMQVDSIIVTADLRPDPLVTRRISAFSLVLKDMVAESILITPDRAPDPLVVRRSIAHDLIQKQMQAISVLTYADRAPDPLIARTSIAFSLLQKQMQPTSILTYADRAPEPLLRLVRAHDPVQKDMLAESILATVDQAPYPLLRTVQAFDLPQKVMQPYAYKAYADFAPPAVLDPLWRRIIAHTPEQKLMQALAILGRRDDAPYPLSRRTIAHEPIQKIMQALGILVKADLAPNPLLTRRIAAFDLAQKVMQAESILAYADNAPDPLVARRVSAFDLPQKQMNVLSILARTDRAPDPLLRYVIAHSILQKEQEPYYATPYPVLVFGLDPLVARRISAHTTEQKVGGKSVLVVRDRAPDPLVARRVSAFELAQKEMEPFLALYDVARIPEPLRTRTTIAFDYIQLVQPRSVLATRDFAPDPLLRYTVAFDPIQKIMQPIPIVIIPDNVPYPLLTRFIQAHDPIHKQTLPTSILLPVFIPEEFYILTGILIERLWQGTISRKWEGRYWKRWLR